MTNNQELNIDLRPEMSADEVVRSITRQLTDLAGDDRYRSGVQRAVPGAREVYGVRVPRLRGLARQVNRTFLRQGEVVEMIADGCWQEGSREHCVLAILMLSGLRGLSSDRRWALGLCYLPEVADWETCDQLCMGLLGPALAEHPGFMDEVEAWVEDPSFWVRRAALATTVMLRRSKAAADVRADMDRRTLGICLRLLDDKEHYVRKAVDWAVREVIRRDYGLGFAWLLERREPMGSVARSTLKLAAKKLTPVDQDLFLRNLTG